MDRLPVPSSRPPPSRDLPGAVRPCVNRRRSQCRPRALNASRRAVESLSREARRGPAACCGSCCVSRGRRRARRTSRRAGQGCCKSRTEIAQAPSEHAGTALRRLVREVDVKFSSNAPGPSAPRFDVSGLPVHEVMPVLAAVNCTIARLDRGLRGLRRGAGGVDATAAAHLERLLRALQDALARARWAPGGQPPDGRRRRGGEQAQRAAAMALWFSVWPGSVRPVSTTWPWTIRPALAVLWGVCWQFAGAGYDEYDAADAADGRLGDVPRARARVRARRFENDLRWQAPRDGAYLQFGLEALGSSPGGARGLRARGGVAAEGPALDVRNSNHPPSIATRRPGGFGHVGPFQDACAQPQLRRNRSPQGSSTHTNPPPPSAAGPRGHLYANALSPNASLAEAQACVWPYQSGIATFDPADALPTFTEQPQLNTPPAHPEWRPPPRLTVPELRVEDLSRAAPLQPAPNDYIFTAALSPHPGLSSFSPFLTPTPMDAAVAAHAQVMPEFSKSPGPVSPVSMNEDISATMPPTAAAVANPRKRKHSDVSISAQPVQPANPQPLPLRESSEEQDRYEGYTPRGKYSHKRTEDPPRNADGKMICTFSSDCNGITFERKCEWSKHMDKHDRPYVCRHKGCEKLQGFTYSGGLLRHEREVHKMHGGTKKALFCPHQDCKRSMGQGFTRKENLAEHIRRVHRRASNSDAASTTGGAGGVKPEDEAGSECGMSPDAEADDAYGGAVGDRRNSAPLSSKKRRTSGAGRGSSIGGGGGETDEDDLREEIRRLRRENEEKDQRLKKLEAAVDALSRGQSMV